MMRTNSPRGNPQDLQPSPGPLSHANSGPGVGAYRDEDEDGDTDRGGLGLGPGSGVHFGGNVHGDSRMHGRSGYVTSITGWIGRTVRGVRHRYRKASTGGKAAIWSIIAINVIVILAIIIITPHRIQLFFEHLAGKLRTLGPGGIGGKAILFTCVVLASHPPLFGFAASMSLIGFAFGFWPWGVIIGVSASMTGASLAFLSIRTFFSGWMQRFGSAKSDKWQAFSHVVKAKGLPLIIMIRWCPLPWAIGNGLFACIPNVSFGSFFLANLLLQPRLIVPVFIGSRMQSLLDEKPKDKVTTIINTVSIIVGMSVSIGTGLFIYRATLARMQQIELRDDLSPEEIEEARDLLEENALLGDYSDGEDSRNQDSEGNPIRREMSPLSDLGGRHSRNVT